jgi:hypothetical protein
MPKILFIISDIPGEAKKFSLIPLMFTEQKEALMLTIENSNTSNKKQVLNSCL